MSLMKYRLQHRRNEYQNVFLNFVKGELVKCRWNVISYQKIVTRYVRSEQLKTNELLILIDILNSRNDFIQLKRERENVIVYVPRLNITCLIRMIDISNI